MLRNGHIHFNGFCFAAENKQPQITLYKDLYRALLLQVYFFTLSMNERF